MTKIVWIFDVISLPPGLAHAEQGNYPDSHPYDVQGGRGKSPIPAAVYEKPAAPRIFSS